MSHQNKKILWFSLCWYKTLRKTLKNYLKASMQPIPLFALECFYINCQSNTSTKFFCKEKGKSVKNDGNYRQVCVTANCWESHNFCVFFGLEILSKLLLTTFCVLQMTEKQGKHIIIWWYTSLNYNSSANLRSSIT